MGKYQLDDKGKAQVRRFHEKHAQGMNAQSKKVRIQALRDKFLEKEAAANGAEKTKS